MKLYELTTPQKENIIVMCSSCECYYEVPNKFNSRFCPECNKSVSNDISGDLKHDLIKKKKRSHPRSYKGALIVAESICKIKGVQDHEEIENLVSILI